MENEITKEVIRLMDKIELKNKSLIMRFQNYDHEEFGLEMDIVDNNDLSEFFNDHYFRLDYSKLDFFSDYTLNLIKEKIEYHLK